MEEVSFKMDKDGYDLDLLSIIVLNYNRLHYSKRTISTLIATTTVPHEFIFVDNGSIDGTREYLLSLEHETNAEKITYIFNDRNFGVAGGRNSGLRVASGEYLMTIDDDILVPHGYDKYFVEACNKINKLGITGINVEKKKYRYVVLDGVDMVVKHGNLGGACLCMPRRVFEKVGYFSPDFVYGGEDCDMYIRLKRLGLISAYIPLHGDHIDENLNAAYAQIKKRMHSEGSKPFNQVGNNEVRYKKTQNVYVPYKEPEIDTKLFDKLIKG